MSRQFNLIIKLFIQIHLPWGIPNKLWERFSTWESVSTTQARYPLGYDDIHRSSNNTILKENKYMKYTK